MTKVILFQGVKRSGKSTGADYLRDLLSINHTVYRGAFAWPLKTAVHAYLGLNLEPEFFDKEKDTLRFEGKTLRQHYIDFSENYVKKNFNKYYWAKLQGDIIDHLAPEVAIISDLGFEDEITYMGAKFGNSRLRVITVDREGTSSEGDSRRLVEIPKDIPQTVISNNGSFREYFKHLASFVADIEPGIPLF